ncbi:MULTISPECIES: conjugal transfer protein TraB [unclassified Phyllobacterium]|uniref:conjugal transfer protein TraB n=1 Tax=unclassified Phyllobacterium TaxID=2638441 RepID=UPI003013151F
MSITIGTGGWSGYVLALPAVLLFPALWAHARSRWIAALVSAGYFLAATRGLPQGVANFYATDLWPGFLLWIGASLSFVAVHAALWTRHPGRGRAVRYLIAATLMAVPPLGIAGWAHPVTAAGMVLPGWGWWGLAITTAGLAIMTTRWWPHAALVFAGFWLWSAATWTPADQAAGWKGIDLREGKSLGRDIALGQHRELIALVHVAAGHGARVVVLPESALGFWTPTVQRLWQDGLRGSKITVLAGAAVVDKAGYDNVLVAVSDNEAEIVYRERMPVPVSMWQPWLGWMGRPGGARAHFFANPVAQFQNRKIAPLVCYEQLIVWPIIQSMLHVPDLIVATGNVWWTSGTSIAAIQRTSASAWARLFAIPIVAAFNM